MKLQDINLDNIKLVIFDFDDTLAIHKDKREDVIELLINNGIKAINVNDIKL